MPYRDEDGRLAQTNVTLPAETGRQWRDLRARLGVTNDRLARELMALGQAKLLARRRKELEEES